VVYKKPKRHGLRFNRDAPITLRKLRKKMRQIEGIALVHKKWVYEYLTKAELYEFLNTGPSRWFKVLTKTCVCKGCGFKHKDPSVSKTYASFWALEKMLMRGV